MCLPESSTNPQVPFGYLISDNPIEEEQYWGPPAGCLFPGLLPLSYPGEKEEGTPGRGKAKPTPPTTVRLPLP